ncbi:exodeoxyribonuclease III [bacterium (Candidatus Blackallbacteria) CG17_big_fil_post_rev_8_21_14_2_50_48_46]|uniref:Exodeoxyribonuclease III n=1 Tax=bacterium (Candidatus Blackallbacteria) CG17_big_fil_post_rev_8_21_14_2_50_48_46 TaxID=2014261 RepID=A0A2M7FXW4_9BACT|nr:MAG: exodeoxyribonuclease III [bacterium (Candidatus Blackallbacteria) CG18_big_fil_WC_8_21_14_2_50_49_26]PIW14140.1 MAG: exodeoxyribonuclease III [bacterium (Candidatus Blackallbacteria) CG17_big_fil_post_rev_8_21_14_2_50_48_46]PIW45870.1 MAG: exodeoxyribonuclease III [bacterium (Candidatus Blackallbacteria) CG13_big_fil_rev_8_21_14_2_50_49_14]
MYLISWNVNGIRSVERKGFLEWLETAQPDLLCLQETKAWPDQLSEELLSGHGYHTYWAKAEKKGYSGVATFARKEPKAVKMGLGIERFDREGRVVVSDHEDFLLYNIYFPNGQRDHGRVRYKLDFYEALLEELNREVAQGRKVIITGDWNTAHQEIDLKNPKTNQDTSGFLPEERAMLDRYIEEGYVDTFRQLNPDARDRYSWWSYRVNARERNIGWRIDYFFVSQNLLPWVSKAEILDQVPGSDHCPVTLTLKL